MYRRQGSRPSPRKRNVKKQNVYVRRTYKIAEKTEVKGKGEKERYTHLMERAMATLSSTFA